MLIVIAPDKFKSTLDSHAVSQAMADGIARSGLEAECIQCPLADGGDGSMDVVLRHLDGIRTELVVTGPDKERVPASFAVLDDGRALIEMASASGLALMKQPDALNATSIGTGELIAAASKASEEIIVFVGGSASTDGGTGAARAIGWGFFDDDGNTLPLGGGALEELDDIRGASSMHARVIAACDVTNPLIGPDGAARVFGPQKGANADDVARLERGIERLLEVVSAQLGMNMATLSHGGAGGGMGAGLSAFFGAELTSGFDFVASAAGLDDALEGADLVITGEGRLDSASFSGKVLSGVVERAKAHGVPCVAIVGSSDLSESACRERGLQEVVTLAELEEGRDAFDAVARAAELLVKRVSNS
ncbi:MAG: glycerate kinase [Actinomycetota bacterium]